MMNLRRVVLAVCAVAISCDRRALPNAAGGSAGAGVGGSDMTGSGGDAAGGSVGTGGTAGGGRGGTVSSGSGGGGTGGTFGSGSGGDGTGGSAPCTVGQTDIVEVRLLASDGRSVQAPVTASVNVTAIESCSTVSCPQDISLSASRLFLTAVGPQSWTLFLLDAAMPSDFIKVGDTFDMTVDASVDSILYASTNQTVVLAHGRDLVLFAATLAKFNAPPLPHLDTFGIGISDLGQMCQFIGQCTRLSHWARVTVGTDGGGVRGGGTVKVGWLTFSNGAFDEEMDSGSSPCDIKSRTLMAGFRSP
jgi:hypothetical protein